MEKWKNLSLRERAAIVTAYLAFIVGWSLTIAGFIVPPTGEIADSVLWVLGQSLVYCASVFGLASYFSAETNKMRKELRELIKSGEAQL